MDLEGVTSRHYLTPLRQIRLSAGFSDLGGVRLQGYPQQSRAGINRNSRAWLTSEWWRVATISHGSPGSLRARTEYYCGTFLIEQSNPEQ